MNQKSISLIKKTTIVLAILWSAIFFTEGQKPPELPKTARHATPYHNYTYFTKIPSTHLGEKPPLDFIPWDISQSNSPSSYHSDPNKEDWVNVLPDENLTDWRELPWPPGNEPDNNIKNFGQQWFVKDGTLLCTSTEGHSHLVSDKQYRNFILHVEWRYLPEEGSHNSGIFVRMKPGEHVMHQCELKNSELRLFGGVLSDSVVRYIRSVEPSDEGEWVQGKSHVPQNWSTLYSEKEYPPLPDPALVGNPYKRKISAVGEWNTTEILCMDHFIILWNNGSICSFTDNCSIMEGSVGFESEGHAIGFRNMVLKEL